MELAPGTKPLHVVEAALFSVGHAISVDEIQEKTGLTKARITKAIEELRALYAERDTVLEIGKAGAKWGMQVRTAMAEPAARFAPMEIAPKLLKTLALIAYHQPMKQSELVDMIGSKVYDHIPELKERGLVKTRREGQTKILTTTAAFPEYFGLDAATPEEIRTALAKAVGLDPAKDAKRKEKGIEGYGEAADEAPSRSAGEPVADGTPTDRDGSDEQAATVAADRGADDEENPVATY